MAHRIRETRQSELSPLILPRERFVAAFMPDVLYDPPAIVREFEPFEYPHLLVMPEFSMALNRAHDAVADVCRTIEPFRVGYCDNPQKALQGRIGGYEIESCTAEPERELQFVHRMLFRAINSRGGLVSDRDLAGSNYEPLIYSLPRQKLPDNYFCALSLIAYTAGNRRKLISNVEFEGDYETAP